MSVRHPGRHVGPYRRHRCLRVDRGPDAPAPQPGLPAPRDLPYPPAVPGTAVRQACGTARRTWRHALRSAAAAECHADGIILSPFRLRLFARTRQRDDAVSPRASIDLEHDDDAERPKPSYTIPGKFW